MGDDRQGIPAAKARPPHPRHDDRDAGRAAHRVRVRGELRREHDPHRRRGIAGRPGREAHRQAVRPGQYAAGRGPGVGRAAVAGRPRGRGRGHRERSPGGADRRQPAFHRQSGDGGPVRRGQRPGPGEPARQPGRIHRRARGHRALQPRSWHLGHHDPRPGRRGARLRRHDHHQPGSGPRAPVRDPGTARGDAAEAARRVPRQDRALLRRGGPGPGHRRERRGRPVRGAVPRLARRLRPRRAAVPVRHARPRRADLQRVGEPGPGHPALADGHAAADPAVRADLPAVLDRGRRALDLLHPPADLLQRDLPGRDAAGRADRSSLAALRLAPAAPRHGSGSPRSAPSAASAPVTGSAR